MTDVTDPLPEGSALHSLSNTDLLAWKARLLDRLDPAATDLARLVDELTARWRRDRNPRFDAEERLNPIAEVALWDSTQGTVNRLHGIYLDEERRATSPSAAQAWREAGHALELARGLLHPDDVSGTRYARRRCTDRIRDLDGLEPHPDGPEPDPVRP